MKTKLTKQQVEQVLSMHATGQLKNGGVDNFGLDGGSKMGVGCLTQIALNEPSCMVSPEGLDNGVAMQEWFDRNYKKDWTAEQFIEQLSAQKFI